MKYAHDIIRRPVLTERSYDNMSERLYTFEVAVSANKVEIKKAIEEIFGVKVEKVNTARIQGKMKRMGRFEGRLPEVKKAYVRLTEDSKGIAFFDGMMQ